MFARDRLQVDGRVNSAPGMAEKRTFEMNAERQRASGISAVLTVRAFRDLRQILERLQRSIQRGGDSRWTITGDAMPHH